MAFEFKGISHYHNQLLNGSLTCRQAVLHYLACIEKNTHLNAMVAVFADEALQKADELDRSRARNASLSPLHGVVVSIKDVLCYENHPVSAGSRMLHGFIASYTATAVQRLLNAGAIIIGVCNCDEFAMGSSNETSAFGAVRNAADPAKVPGGSSGGSAVAVQAGLCMVSLGSDTGGSVRQPADFCGVYGLKPTYGRISRYGLIAYGSSFDCVGVFANTLEDTALVFEAMAGHDPLDATSLSIPVQPFAKPEAAKKYRFACLDATLTLPGLDPEIKSSIEGLFSALTDAGHTVAQIPFSLLDYVVPTYYVLTTAEASSNLSRYDGVRFGHRTDSTKTDLTEFYKTNRSEGFGTEVKRRIMLGSFVLSSGYYDAYFTKAQQVRKMLVDQMAGIFRDYDILLMPVSPTTAFPLGGHTGDPVSMYLADIYTVMANLTGNPALAVPGFTHSNGMPFGLQLIANHADELTLHQAGCEISACIKP